MNIKNISMNKGSTFFLRGVVIVLGGAVFALCIWVLRVVGSFDAGGYDPILLGLYLPAIPFFIALYQTWKLLGYIDTNIAFSNLSVKALKNIKKCALAISGIYIVGMPYIFYVADKDDAPGVVLMALIVMSASLVIAVFAAVLQRLLTHALDIKSENELTV